MKKQVLDRSDSILLFQTFCFITLEHVIIIIGKLIIVRVSGLTDVRPDGDMVISNQ